MKQYTVQITVWPEPSGREFEIDAENDAEAIARIKRAYASANEIFSMAKNSVELYDNSILEIVADPEEALIYSIY